MKKNEACGMLLCVCGGVVAVSGGRGIWFGCLVLRGDGTCNEKSYGIKHCCPRDFFVNTYALRCPNL